MALLIQNRASGANTTQLQVGYNIGAYADYSAADYIVNLHGPYNGEVYDTAFAVSYVSGQSLPNGYNNPFTSFCMYINADLVPSDYWRAIAYSGVNTSQLGYSFGTASLYRAVNLYNAYVGTVNFASQSGEINGGALQLAIWDVLYGNNVTSVNDPSSQFFVTPVGNESAAAIAQANAFLNSSANNSGLVYQSTFWESTDASGNPLPTSNQDLIGPEMATGFVPEPGTCAAAAIAGLYAIIGLGRSAARKLRA